MTTVTLGETTLAEFIRGEWEIKDLYPIAAAFTTGQKSLIKMGQLETVLKYNSPSKPIAELTATLNAMEEGMKDENGNPIVRMAEFVDYHFVGGTVDFPEASAPRVGLTSASVEKISAVNHMLLISVTYKNDFRKLLK